ncbi:MAG: hypothetical protein AAFO96_29895, partial [Bacteroidota bacterium]
PRVPLKVVWGSAAGNQNQGLNWKSFTVKTTLKKKKKKKVQEHVQGIKLLPWQHSEGTPFLIHQ